MSDDTENKTKIAQLPTTRQIEELGRITVLKRVVYDVHGRILASGKTPSAAQLQAQNSMFGQGIDTLELLTASALAMREMIDQLIRQCVDPMKLEEAGKIVCLGNDPRHFLTGTGCPSCGWPEPEDLGDNDIPAEEKDRIEAMIRHIAGH